MLLALIFFPVFKEATGDLCLQLPLQHSCRNQSTPEGFIVSLSAVYNIVFFDAYVGEYDTIKMGAISAPISTCPKPLSKQCTGFTGILLGAILGGFGVFEVVLVNLQTAFVFVL